MHYFDSLANNLETIFYKIGQCMSKSYQFYYNCLILILNCWKHQRQKDFLYQYQQKKHVIDKRENDSNTKHTIFDNYIMGVFLFIATILSMIATAAIVHIMCKHAKVKALPTGIAFQPIRDTDTIFGNEN